MNLTSEESEAANGVLFVNFNQTSTSLSVGTKYGYKLYDLQDIHRLESMYECAMKEDICIVERHFLSSLVGIVSLSSPRKLTFYNFKNGAEICVKHFPNTILSLKLNRKTFVVCLEQSLHIHNIMMMSSIHTITNVPPNPSGLCSLSVSNADGYLAYPGSSSTGDVQIFDVSTKQPKITIPAHNSPLAAMSFNEDGSLVATASVKGTVIRVFNVTYGTNLFEFRRSVTRYATIYSLSFSTGSDFLCASSSTETVHVFKLSPADNESKIVDESEGWINMFGKLLSSSAQYLPSQVSEIFTQRRSYASVQLPFSGMKNISSIAMVEGVPHIIVVSSDGFVYIYSVTASEDTTGVCTLVKQHRIDGSIKATESPVIQASPQMSRAPAASKSPLTAPSTSLKQGSLYHVDEEETEEKDKESGDFASSYSFKLPYDCEFPSVPYKVD